MSTDSTDQVERQIDIDTNAGRVWALVSEPGWFINQGGVSEHRIEPVGDGVHVVHEPAFGAFTVRTITLDEPRYAAFRWEAGRSDAQESAGSTLIEFWIEDRPEATGVTLRVRESGFASLTSDAEQRRATLDENTSGWVSELAAARSYVEAQVVAAT